MRAVVSMQVRPDRVRLPRRPEEVAMAKTIGDLVQRIVATNPPRPSDLLNGVGKLCRCPGACTGHMPKDPSRPGD